MSTMCQANSFNNSFLSPAPKHRGFSELLQSDNASTNGSFEASQNSITKPDSLTFSLSERKTPSPVLAKDFDCSENEELKSIMQSDEELQNIMEVIRPKVQRV